MSPFQKTSKSPPFDEAETTLLKLLINEKLIILENRSINRAAIKENEDAWDSITQEYAVLAPQNGLHTPRDTRQIQNFWKNRKQR